MTLVPATSHGGSPAYGELSITGASTVLTLTNQNQWYPLASDWVAGEFLRSVLNAGAGTITVAQDGDYATEAAIAFTSTAAPQTIEFGLFKDGTIIAGHKAVTWTDTQIFPNTVPITGVDALLSGNVIGVRARCTTAALVPITITDANLNMFAVTGPSVIGTTSGGLPPWFQSGTGSPVGSVIPAQQGALYQDTMTGGLYVAVGATNADWVICGGDIPAPTITPGVVSNARGANLVGGAGGALITDTAAFNGTGNGLYWEPQGGDGLQALQLTIGSTGQFAHTWGAAGTYLAPLGIGVFGHAAPAAQPATPVLLADVIAILQAYGLCQ